MAKTAAVIIGALRNKVHTCILTLTFDSKVIPGIQKILCHLHTSDKQFVKDECPSFKDLRGDGFTIHKA